jgi:hypothetical protein
MTNIPRPKYDPECAMWFYKGRWYDEDPTPRWEEDLEELAIQREEYQREAYGRRT